MQDFKKGDKVRYIGDSAELVGLEGILAWDTTANSSYTKFVVTKGNNTYSVDNHAFPDTKNIELVQANESDPVEHPAHYTQYPVEVIELTRHMNFCRGNAVKYIARAGHKDKSKELEDLKKARWYIDDEIKQLEESSNT